MTMARSTAGEKSMKHSSELTKEDLQELSGHVDIEDVDMLLEAAKDDGRPTRIPQPKWPPRETRTYMLSAKVEDGLIQFYFKQRPGKPKWDGDGALDVRIPNHCKVRFLLDPDLRWSFRHDFKKNVSYPHNDAITLAKCVPDGMYTDLRHISDQEVTFNAMRRCRWPDNTAAGIGDCKGEATEPLKDAFNIYVDMEQMTAEMIPGIKSLFPKRLSVIIDPDIKNPGDDTQGKQMEIDAIIKFILERWKALQQ